MLCKNIEAHLAMQKLVSIMKSVPFTQRNMVASNIASSVAINMFRSLFLYMFNRQINRTANQYEVVYFFITVTYHGHCHITSHFHHCKSDCSAKYNSNEKSDCPIGQVLEFFYLPTEIFHFPWAMRQGLVLNARECIMTLGCERLKKGNYRSQ